MTTNAESFKESYNVFEPDVIVLDVVMPEIDGIELVKYLSTQECGARILVISGYAQRYLDNTKALGEAFGLMSVMAMSKPIELPKLEEFLTLPDYSDNFKREEFGAGRGNRTLDTKLGKLVLYH